MKKILLFIFSFMLLFTLVGCGDETLKLTIEFDELGGTEVEDLKINKEDISSIKLDDKLPTKEGFTFGGWFVNAECTEAFKNEILTTAEGTIKLYAKWNPILSENEFLVKFQTNGAEAVADLVLTKAEDGTYDLTKLPELTKEGYIFLGWYSDEALTSKVALSDFADKKDLTLYAKWGEEIDFNKFGAKYTNSQVIDFSLNGKAAKVNLEYSLDVATKNLDLEDLSKLDAYFALTLKGTVEGELLKDLGFAQPVDSVTPIAGFILQALSKGVKIELYAKDGFLCANIPAEIAMIFFNSPIETEFYSVKIDLTKVAETLKKLLEENKEDMPEIDVDEIKAKVEELKTLIVGLLEETGVDKVLSTDLVQLLSILAPKKVIEGDKVTYTIDDTQFKLFLVKLPEFLSNNLYKIMDLVNKLIDNLEDSVGFVEEDLNVIDAEKGGWYDAEGKFHSFAEDEDNVFGYTIGNYYICYYLDDVFFDISNNYAPVKGKFVDNAYVLEGDTSIYVYDFISEKFVKTSFEEDLNKLNYGYIDNTIGVYVSYFGYVFQISPFKLLTDAEYLKLQADYMAQSISPVLALVSSMVKINKLEASVTQLKDKLFPSEVTLSADLSLEIPAEFGDGEKQSINLKYSLVYGLEIVKEPTYVTPDFAAVEDLTDMILGAIKGE